MSATKSFFDTNVKGAVWHDELQPPGWPVMWSVPSECQTILLLAPFLRITIDLLALLAFLRGPFCSLAWFRIWPTWASGSCGTIGLITITISQGCIFIVAIRLRGGHNGGAVHYTSWLGRRWSATGPDIRRAFLAAGVVSSSALGLFFVDGVPKGCMCSCLKSLF